MVFSSQDIQARRQRVQEKWNQLLGNDEAVLIYSGDPIQKPGGLDQTYPFLPHPGYYWLTGRRRESEVVLYSKEYGWLEFQKEIGADEAVWEGERSDLLVNNKGQNLKDLSGFLEQKKFSNLYRLGQSGEKAEGKAFDLRTAFDQERRKKDAAEVKFIQQLSAIAEKGYRKLESFIRPGLSEKEVQLAYETEIYLNGAHTVPYETIVGSGPNSAILHAIPTQRIIQEGEFVLIDAGVDQYDYCVDITRTYTSSSSITQQHKALYQLVWKAHAECIAMSAPGVMWRDVHLHAAKVITEGLLQLGILKGSLDSLLEKEVSSAFFPHGVGHLVGLRVRDTGHEENLQPKMYAGARLRVDIELQPGHLITVEPGCYFIDSLLDRREIREKFNHEINWNEVNKWKGIGGVRIEDNILITTEGNQNLTMNVSKTEGLGE